MEKQEFIALIDRHLNGQSTELEDNLIRNYLDSFQQGDAWDVANEGSRDVLLSAIHKGLLSQISQQPAPVYQIRSRITAWVKYAAAVLIIASLATVVILQPWKRHHTETAVVKPITDIKPGSKGAYLTLGNGQQIEIDQVKTGERVGDAVKTAGGIIVYTTKANIITNNTYTVPRGAEPRQLELPDHTMVWLNSESSITYPTSFTRDTREISMTGEVYFEVAKEKNYRHFFAQTRTDRIEVTGTHFNIRAYADEQHVQTTLFEGAVRVGNTLLAPGEQYENGYSKKMDAATLQRIMAWKNGLFAYDKVDVQTLMRDLGRYYDVDVVFQGQPTKRIFEGKIGRSLSLKEVLEGLQFTELNYRLEKGASGNRIVIIP